MKRFEEWTADERAVLAQARGDVIRVLPPGGHGVNPRERQFWAHIHSVDGLCVKDRSGSCPTPKGSLSDAVRTYSTAEARQVLGLEAS